MGRLSEYDEIERTILTGNETGNQTRPNLCLYSSFLYPELVCRLPKGHDLKRGHEFVRPEDIDRFDDALGYKPEMEPQRDIYKDDPGPGPCPICNGAAPPDRPCPACRWDSQ